MAKQQGQQKGSPKQPFPPQRQGGGQPGSGSKQERERDERDQEDN